MNEKERIKGYKVFNPDWTCRSFQYTCPGTFEENVIPSTCKTGFHFCQKAADCFKYYSFDAKNKVAEVIALGDVDCSGDKCCTNKIQIVREVPWSELLEIVNTGKWCSGLCNSGDCNSGDCNSGNCNSGNRNSGNRNSGDWNKTNFSNGCFNTVEPTIFLFNKPSDWTFRKWRSSDACWVLSGMPVSGSMLEYVHLENMSEKEKAKHPEAATTGGYLKVLNKNESRQIWWDGLSYSRKKAVMSLPNFDQVIFAEITGIKVNYEKESQPHENK